MTTVLMFWILSSETELAEKLVKEGPHKKELANRRVRALLGGKWIFDTLDAQFVWEHPYCRPNGNMLCFFLFWY